MLTSRLMLWRSMGKNKVFPENILVYRDGVSESQYQGVLDNEGCPSCVRPSTPITRPRSARGASHV